MTIDDGQNDAMALGDKLEQSFHSVSRRRVHREDSIIGSRTMVHPVLTVINGFRGFERARANLVWAGGRLLVTMGTTSFDLVMDGKLCATRM